MLDLEKYSCLGAALEAAVETFAEETCLIEADREKEKERITYRQFGERGAALASALEEEGFAPGTRVGIVLTNQSKWLLSAYAVLYAGGVLVPIDWMLTPDEQWELLAHSGAQILVTEYALWQRLAKAPARAGAVSLRFALVSEAPEGADLSGARRWEEFCGRGAPALVPRERGDLASIGYSSGTGGRPKGCMLTHGNYLAQCVALTRLYPFWPGLRYLSILPTSHAIDFMVGFIGPFTCGATVVHLRTLRPEYFRDAFTRYHIGYVSVVPLVLKNLRAALEARFRELPRGRRRLFDLLRWINRALTRSQPRLGLSRRLLRQVHDALGGQLRAIIVGGAFSEPETLQFFYDLGIPVANGYGQTEACTAVAVNDLKPFRADTVGKPLRGIEVRIANPDSDGVGEIEVRGKTVMAGYLDDPELTRETIVDGWLRTGDLGRFDPSGHLQLFGRRKNMIVSPEGLNIYPENVEGAFTDLPVEEFAVFAANYIWPERTMVGERLVLVLRLKKDQVFDDRLRREIGARNSKLKSYQRVEGVVLTEQDFPLTTGRRLKRHLLKERLAALDRGRAILPL
jgi:long-chain acyl-CoA synthetase